MQMKTMVRYYLTPVRMADIKKSSNNTCWRGCGEKGALVHCWWECKLVQTQYGDPSKNYKQNYHMTQKFYSRAYS